MRAVPLSQPMYSDDFKLISLKISGFKNLNNLEIDFSNRDNLAIIIGNNASGKSNILEAISAIFTEVFTRKRFDNFTYELVYEQQSNKLSISRTSSCPTLSYNVNDRWSSRNNFIRDHLPSRIIVLYSGEETRLWDEYYSKFYCEYLRDLGRGWYPYSKRMLYVDRRFWNIALLTLLMSDNEEHKVFIKEKLHINNVNKIKMRFYNRDMNNCINPQLVELLNDINPNDQFETHFTLDDLKNKMYNIAENEEKQKEKGRIRSNDEIFELLIYGCMKANSKYIDKLEIDFNGGISLKHLSEGEKKKLLIKVVMDLVANEKAIVLLDEPDAHIHEKGKEEIYKDLKKYSSERRHVIMTTHSPTITSCADDKHIIMLNNENGQTNIIPVGKQACIKKLTGGMWSAQEQNIFLTSQTPLILVEGKNDIAFIKHAFKLFAPDDLMPDFLSFGGAGNAADFISELQPNISPNKKVIVLFDRDEAGVKDGLKKCINPMPTVHGRNDDNIYKKGNVYFLLLPKTQEHNEENTEFMIEDYFSKKCKLKIAVDFVNSKNRVVKSYKGLDVHLKGELLNKINVENNCFDGFKVLLEKINSIIDETATCIAI